jgi:hypothetical protein
LASLPALLEVSGSLDRARRETVPSVAMTEETTTTGTATHTRDELLRMLRQDPHSVTRAEIKAAFQDGRLGDQDLDIPTLAGMRRISELLADVQQAPTEPVKTPARRQQGPKRDPITPRPLTEIDHELAALAARIESQDRLLREADVSIESLRRKLEQGVPAGRAVRQLWLAVAGVGILAAVALLVALLAR